MILPFSRHNVTVNIVNADMYIKVSKKLFAVDKMCYHIVIYFIYKKKGLKI